MESGSLPPWLPTWSPTNRTDADKVVAAMLASVAELLRSPGLVQGLTAPPPEANLYAAAVTLDHVARELVAKAQAGRS